MVKMALGSSDSQASSTSSASASRIDAYQTAIGSLESFMGAGNLQGEAYSSAKSYAGNVLIPLFRGAILLSEGVNTAVNRLPSDYRGEVADESLDSEVLEQEIATYQAAYNRSSEWLSNEMSKEVLSESSILRAQQSMARNLSKVQELQEKLEKLIAFDGKSPSLFSEVDGLYAAVSQGLSQVKEGFSSFSGSFSLPPKSEMAWAATINSAWEQREAVLASLSNPEGMTAEEVGAVASYIGSEVEGTREILLYDNYYGYAKYKITLSATKDGDISISYNKEGVDGLKTSSNAVSSKGRYTSSQSVPVKGSALDKGLFNGSYQYAFDQNGVSGLSAALSGGNSRSEFGVKYVNGALAAYSQTQSTASAALSDKSKGELSVAYEQGQYIRKSGDSPHMTQAAYLMDDIREVNWGQATSDVVEWTSENSGAILTTAVVIGGTILAGIYAGPALGVGWLVTSVSAVLFANDEDNHNEESK